MTLTKEQKEKVLKRNAEIYDNYCNGAKHKAQSFKYGLAETYIKQICMKERRLRGLVKIAGKRQ